MLFSLLVAAGLSLSPAADTLQAVTVVADRGVVVSRTDTVFVQSHQDVSATLQYFPGLYVGDYGGLSGLKSASLRGLGSAHTAIYVDGIRMGNVQSGQADLGLINLESLSMVTVDYAQNSLSFHTARPVFKGRPVAGRFSFAGGSYLTLQPFGRVDIRLSDKVSLSTFGSVQSTNGYRTNGDLFRSQAGADLFGTLHQGDYHVKVYTGYTNRGTPGSVDWPSTDRQADRNFYAQGLLRKTFSPVYSLNLSAKAAYDGLHYQSEWGDSDYIQKELQLNSSHKFHLQPWWDVSLAADVAYDKLNSNLYNQGRWSTVGALASAFHFARFKANLALEYDGTFDKGTSPWHSLSPSADIRLTLVDGLDLVAFGRRAYRTPTFNELYYPGYGNTELKPEDAWLTDLGLDFNRKMGNVQLSFRADAFYNYLTNKIISAPSADDPYVWLPYNVGKVQALGADVLTNLIYTSASGFMLGCSIRYGYQKALDKTPDSATYDQPIPYVAAHSLMVNPMAAWKGWVLGATWNLRAGRRDSAGDMPDWNTLDAQLGKDIPVGSYTLGLRLTGRNLFNHTYEAVTGYPMPGRTIMGGVNFTF